MSKMDELRALREARYQQEAAGGTRSTAAVPRKAAAARPATKPSLPKAGPAEIQTGLCGHRSMNGRTCTREQGHTAKSHRYS